MAGARKTIMDQLADQNKKRGGFFTGLKNWAISPGGIATILMGLSLLWLIHHNKKEAK